MKHVNELNDMIVLPEFLESRFLNNKAYLLFTRGLAEKQRKMRFSLRYV